MAPRIQKRAKKQLHLSSIDVIFIVVEIARERIALFLADEIPALDS